MTLDSTLLRDLAQAEREAAVRYKGGREISLLSILDNWWQFVEEVARGYEGGVDDYVYELSRRDLIEDIANHASVAGKNWIMGVVHHTDKEFIKATKPDSDFAIRSLANASAEWWWDREPTRLGALAAELPGLGVPGDPPIGDK